MPAVNFFDDRGLFYSFSCFSFPEDTAKDATDRELLDMFLKKNNDANAIAELPGVIQETRTSEQNGMTIRGYPRQASVYAASAFF